MDDRRTVQGQPDRVHCPQDLPEVCEILDISFAGSLDFSARMMLRDVRRISQLGGAAWQAACLLGAVNPAEWVNGVVWREAGRVAGFASLTPRPGEPSGWVLANVAVHPEMRGRGVGRGLVRFSLQRARELGAARIYLQVDEDNRTAERIYTEHGFREIDRRITWVHTAGDTPAQPAGRDGVQHCVARERRPGDWKAEFAFLQAAAPNGLGWNYPLTKARIRPSLWRQIALAAGGERQAHYLGFCGSEPCAALILRENFASWEGLLFSPRETETPCAPDLVRAAFRGPILDRPGALETGPQVNGDAMRRLGFTRRRTLIWMLWEAGEGAER